MEVSEKVKVLQDLIKIHSVNGNEVEVAHYLQKLLSSHGIDSKVDEFGDRRANLIAEIGTGESKKFLDLLGTKTLWQYLIQIAGNMIPLAVKLTVIMFSVGEPLT